ncbi:hypothetical protein FOVSG1_005746 [Fusarium oxysporum f. sp. vasinfectum]
MDENGWIQERFVAFPSKREASRCQGQNLEACCRSPSLWIQYCAEYGYQLSIHSNTNDTRKAIKEQRKRVKLQNTKRDPRRTCHRDHPRINKRFTGLAAVFRKCV